MLRGTRTSLRARIADDADILHADSHNRMAHIGIELRPAFRGRGLGAEMAVAGKLGFTREGTTRGSSWVNGGFTDDVLFGLLVEEYGG